jgi:transcriptional regulator of heat shock response
MRYIDTREREEEILGLVVDSYITESKPISSGYLCDKYNLKYSSATVRNVLLSLEQQGYLLHIHTSSGRVPTKDGFKYYVSHLKDEDIIKDNPLGLDDCASKSTSLTEVIDHTLDTLTRFSGYTSLVAVSGRDHGLFFKGMRFILEQPEFGDIECLRDIFHALEVRMDELQDILFKCVDEKIQILIGDDIGFDEISNCSLVVSGFCEDNVHVALALLGPMRMNYLKAASCLYSVKRQMGSLLEEFI